MKTQSTPILLLLAAALFVSCNPTREASRDLDGEVWNMTQFRVNGVDQSLYAMAFDECDLYEEVCTGELQSDTEHAPFAWQIRTEGTVFEFSYQAGDHSHDPILEGVAAAISGVYTITEKTKDEMTIESSATQGYPGREVEIQLKKTDD